MSGQRATEPGARTPSGKVGLLNDADEFQICTCGSDAVESRTLQGWKLLEVREEEQFVLPARRSTNEVPPNATYPVWVDKQDPAERMKRLVFVLTRSRDAVVEEARNLLAAAEQRTAEIGELRYKAEEARVAAQAAAEKAEKEREESVAALEKERAARVDIDRRCRKLETDLAKLRTELGDARWREILNQPAVDAGHPYRSGS